MNLLYLNHNIVNRSTFHRCFGFAKELVSFGHSVTILTNSSTERVFFRLYKKNNVKVVECPDLLWGSLRTGWDPVNVVRRCIYLRNLKFDLIHAFDTRPTVIIPALYYKKFVKNIPLVIDWADWWGRVGAIEQRSHKILNKLFSPIETFFEENFRIYADYTTATGKLLGKRAIDLGISEKKISVIWSGMDIQIKRLRDRNGIRNKLGLPEDAFICIYPSFVLYDLEMVLEIYKYIRKIQSQAVLLLIGDYSKELREPYNRYIKEGSIRIFKNVDKKSLWDYLYASDVGLLPLSDTLANRARFPIKFGDFLSAQLPFVTNDVGDIGYLVRKYRLAYITKFRSNDMGKKILWIFHHPKVAQIKADRAYSKAKNVLSWRHLTQQLLEIYERLIN